MSLRTVALFIWCLGMLLYVVHMLLELLRPDPVVIVARPMPTTPAPADLPNAGPGRACDPRPVQATSAAVTPA